MGAGGYAWSSSPNSATSTSGSNLNFSSSSVNPETTNYRAYAFPVRCVQLCISREQRPFTDFAEARQSGASKGGARNKRGRGHPASGIRDSWSGDLDYVGTSGYAWSSSPDAASNDGGAYLNFGSSRVNPENYNSRTLGFPVRYARLSWVLWGDSTSAR